MKIDEFLELARTRRSIRRFKPDPIPDEYIEKILEAARWAQSGANAQPWEFIVVKNPETKSKIVEIYTRQVQQSWDIEKTRVKELRQPAYREGPHAGPSGFQNAPIFILVCGDPRTAQASVLSTHFVPNEGGPMAHFLKSMSNATQILTLAAAACGLGAQWVSINTVTELHLRPLLGVPDEIAIHTLVPIGYPAYEPPSPYRRELKEMVHYEKFDPARIKSTEDSYQWLVAMRERSSPAYKIMGTVRQK